MRSVKGPSMVLAAAILLSACSQGGQNQAAERTGNSTEEKTHSATAEKARVITGNPAEGKKIFDKYCYFCHGRRGMGDGPIGIAITPHPADFVHDRKRMSRSDEKLLESITQGIRREIGGEEMSMPRWADILSEQERWDVLSYIRELERLGIEAEKGAAKSGAGR
ncbi:MAG: c-type cytochrome [Thermodesulfobacteriota bacterium]